MRCMERNKVRFYYALFTGREAVRDAYGNVSGEYDVRHGDPVECYANISAAKGETETRQFGEDVSYDKVIVTDASPMDEYSVLWVDRMPLLDENGALAVDEDGNVLTPHDYEVKRVAGSLNSVLYAISKVQVS